MNRMNLFILSIILLVVTVACNEKTNIDIGDAVGKTEHDFRQLQEIETTASSFDGKKTVKFRLMVEGHPTEAEASILFNRILDTVAKYSNRPDVWEYYEGYFDIKNYDEGVIYEGIKLIGEDLKVQ
ncbi:hypothetical protein [Paenibacillus lignilyticus]|uniref:Lipoprotein n=1 Tax=Paenibacillus lignilyticus TaxID=1172615 RepID=A0ABS5CB01_9BACL|nr:hypothetical protein [Paenibacillus lignilyticus]MBP3962862.1 hypothetical protein [Paenibacillus lignilyticus]